MRLVSAFIVGATPRLPRAQSKGGRPSGRAGTRPRPYDTTDVHIDLMRAYRSLLRQYGPQGWWPIYRMKNDERRMMKYGQSMPLIRHPCPRRLTEEIRFQICIGAILTQNTAWTNVERAFKRFLHVNARSTQTTPKTHDREKRGRFLPTHVRRWAPEYVAALPRPTLARLIRPAGYFNQKAKKLHIFSRWLLREYDGSLARFFRLPTADCRQQLLSLWGIGPETADSMLLYAGRHPVFVIDAYTKRFLAQYGITFCTYDAYQRFFMDRLPQDATLFNEYHALIVAWTKEDRALRRGGALSPPASTVAASSMVPPRVPEGGHEGPPLRHAICLKT